jgi:hypothetical protein
MTRSTFVLAAALLLGGVAPGAAEVYRPWCAQYYGGDGNNGTTCAFTSYDQCMMTARGSGAICVQNPWYRPAGRNPDGQAERPRRR